VNIRCVRGGGRSHQAWPVSPSGIEQAYYITDAVVVKGCGTASSVVAR
jgi:hypothetical protein